MALDMLFMSEIRLISIFEKKEKGARASECK